MSLTVPEEVQALVATEKVDSETFWSVVADSLPFAVEMIEQAVGALEAGESVQEGVLIYNAQPPGEDERGQLLRLLASSSMRQAAESRFGIKLGFVNCHYLAVKQGSDENSRWREVTSPTFQLRMQRPELVDC